MVPGFDAKGIETVRRDTCPAVAKTMERSLRLLFATRDLSEVRPHSHTLPSRSSLGILLIKCCPTNALACMSQRKGKMVPDAISSA